MKNKIVKIVTQMLLITTVVIFAITAVFAQAPKISLKANKTTGKPSDKITFTWNVKEQGASIDRITLRMDGYPVEWTSPHNWTATPGTHNFTIEVRWGGDHSGNDRPFVINYVDLEIGGNPKASFNHPGIYYSQKELDVIKRNINGKASHPMKKGLQVFLKSKGSKIVSNMQYSSLDWIPHPVAIAHPKTSDKQKLLDDSRAVYAHALQWVITGNQEHADKAIEIMNAWSAVFKDIVTENGDVYNKLFNSWQAQFWVAGAEIIRHYKNEGKPSGWKKKDIAKFEDMCRVFERLTLQWIGYNGYKGGQNQGNGVARTQLALAIFLDDQALFDAGTNLLFEYQFDGKEIRKRHGHSVNLVGLTVASDGEIMELNRDAAHGSGSLNSLVNSAEILRHQNVPDKYKLYDLKLDGDKIPRLLKGAEYCANSYLNSPTDLSYRKGFKNNVMGEYTEFICNYYKYLSAEKYALPLTTKANKIFNPLGQNVRYVAPWTTLTHAELSAGILEEKTDNNDKKLGLIAKVGSWGFRPASEYHKKNPHILLIGNSICSQYSKVVIPALEGVADVDVWVTPAHLNSKYLEKRLSTILSMADYDVIHFNIGLHGWSDGRIPKGKYEELMEKYVKIYEKYAPNSKLIWASTTSISETREDPTKLDPIHNQTIVKRNVMAKKIMKEHKIPINDLYTLTVKNLNCKGDRFHYKSCGVKLLSDAVVEHLIKALNVK